MVDNVMDQFAFRRIVSITLALTFFTLRETRMLEINAYVRCSFLDFSKAFDRVDHVILVEKLDKLHLPGYMLIVSLLF